MAQGTPVIAFWKGAVIAALLGGTIGAFLTLVGGW